MDVEANPGPTTAHHLSNTQSVAGNVTARYKIPTTSMSFSCARTFADQNIAQHIYSRTSTTDYFSTLSYLYVHHKISQGITSRLRYRGNRAGKRVQERRQLRKLNIQTVISHHRRRPQKQFRTANCANLSYLKPIQQSNPGCHKIQFAVWNGQSINNKASIICDIILSNHLDMLAVTETWLCSGVNTSIADILNSLHDFSLAGPKSHRTRGRDSNLHP